MQYRWGTFCSPEEDALSQLANPTIHCLTRGESIGLAFAAEAGLLSVLSLVVAFAFILRNAIRGSRRRPRRPLIQIPMDLFLLSLFVAEFSFCLAMALNVKWVYNGKVFTGTACRTQSIFLSLGATTSSMTNIAISVNTFGLVWWRRGRSILGAWIVVVLIWLYAIFFVSLAATIDGANNVYRPSPYWCSFGSHYIAQKLVGEYFWMWFATLMSLLLYTPLFLWRRGHITLNPDVWWRFSFQWRRKSDLDEQRRRSMNMIFYPLVYCITVLPASAIRWTGFMQEFRDNGINHVPSAATIGGRFVFGLSGIANVVLYLATRPRLLLFPRYDDVEGNGDDVPDSLHLEENGHHRGYSPDVIDIPIEDSENGHPHGYSPDVIDVVLAENKLEEIGMG